MPKVKYEKDEIDLPDGATGKDLAEKLNLREPHQSIAIEINGNTTDLSHPLQEGDEVKLWHFEDAEGKEVFWHTSAHVLAQAVLRLWPDAEPTIGPPIENGFYYDFANLHISDEDFKKIEKEIKKILSENFKPELHRFEDKADALKEFGSNPYKKELIEGFDEGSPITAYRQGDFFDLCRGPHLPNLGKIKAFKVLKTSGAYWRGNSDNEMLTRIYGISFPDREQLKQYLFMLEEAKKRDHRIIGTKLDLFSFKEEAPAMPFFHPNGMAIWDSLVEFWRDTHLREGYQIIKTPQLMTKELWVTSGHWEHYRENMFTSQVSEEREFAIKPMNCPGCMLYYKSHSHSYREFPLRVAEFGHVHRHEPSGALNGLFRVQGFHQDDAHLFMKPDQIQDEILNVLNLVKQIYETFGLKYTFELSTRPESSIGTDEDWEVGTQGLQKALDAAGLPYKINEGDGAFYGPKIDLHVHDALGRAWQCGTIQLDMALPERFDLEYKDADGSLKRPIMIHRAIFGSIERFLGILIEHFAGKFPLWMSPLPIRLIPVADTHAPYAHEVAAKIRQAGFSCDVDDSHESVGKKVRNAQIHQINYMLTVGDNEVANKTIALRTRDNVVHGEIQLDDFLKNIESEYKERRLTSPYQEGK
ncbi:threonine--tRNA ligase [Simkania sp.]|uniref:threonine--tRNA ligase n=1 Tax=Simkania sp. TaxID=34094 RepID=UPI003B529C86